MEDSRIIVLCSGGLKSAALLAYAVRETKRLSNSRAKLPTALFYRHGQLAADHEHIAVMELAAYYGVDYQVRRLATPGSWPPLKMNLMLADAALWAYLHRYYTIYYGASRDDKPINEGELEYISRFNDLLTYVQPDHDKHGTGYAVAPKVQIEAPFIQLDMPRVIRLFRNWQVPAEKTWCCEQPIRNKACGICRKCLRRKAAYIREGSIDPTVYAQPKGKRQWNRHKLNASAGTDA